MDIVYLRNPFASSPAYLHRDADIEAMTDGWSDETAYGWHLSLVAPVSAMESTTTEAAVGRALAALASVARSGSPSFLSKTHQKPLFVQKQHTS